MKRLAVTLLALSLVHSRNNAYCGGIGVCGLYAHAFQSGIKTQIESGIAFELMSALFEDGSLIFKKVVHVSYNLWDELVLVKSSDRVLGKFSLKDGRTELCKYLEIEEVDLKHGQRYTYRLLLNPMWSERMTRLQFSAGNGVGIGHNRLIGINWQKLAREMPSDSILIEKEIDK